MHLLIPQLILFSKYVSPLYYQIKVNNAVLANCPKISVSCNNKSSLLTCYWFILGPYISSVCLCYSGSQADGETSCLKLHWKEPCWGKENSVGSFAGRQRLSPKVTHRCAINSHMLPPNHKCNSTIRLDGRRTENLWLTPSMTPDPISSQILSFFQMQVRFHILKKTALLPLAKRTLFTFLIDTECYFTS